MTDHHYDTTTDGPPDFSKEADLLRRLRAATRPLDDYVTVMVIITAVGAHLRATYGDAVAADFLNVAMS